MIHALQQHLFVLYSQFPLCVSGGMIRADLSSAGFTGLLVTA